MKTIFALLILLASSPAFASWDNLVSKTIWQGTRVQTEYGTGAYLTYKEGSLVQYFSLILDPTFRMPFNHSASLEIWTTNADGTTRLDQTLFGFSFSGDITRVSRNILTYAGEGNVIDRKQIFFNREPTDEDRALWESALRNLLQAAVL